MTFTLPNVLVVLFPAERSEKDFHGPCDETCIEKGHSVVLPAVLDPALFRLSGRTCTIASPNQVPLRVTALTYKPHGNTSSASIVARNSNKADCASSNGARSKT